MKKSKTFQKSPNKVIVEKGKTYFWCSCGQLNKQSFCNGAHKKKEKYNPFKYLPSENKEVYFCSCRKTNHPPFCDGSHSKP